MKITKWIGALFAIPGLMLLGLTVAVALAALDADPVLLTPTDSAKVQTETLMEAVSQGDYAAAALTMYGTPDLGADRDPEDPVGKLLWNAFVESLSYEFQGECYADETGLARDVTVSYLDLSAVTAALGTHSQKLLPERVAQAEDVSEIYDENNEYREAFIQQILLDAAALALEENAAYGSREVTLQLIYQADQWWIIPDQALLKAISGGIAG